jgi:hypothetical protein
VSFAGIGERSRAELQRRWETVIEERMETMEEER